MGDRGRAYDDEISPLMTQIIAICKRDGIPLVATFELDDDEDDGPLYCSTALLGDGFETHGDRLQRMNREQTTTPGFCAYTITTTGDPQ